jgi:DNA-binding beta-propeller fold protein YncE
MEGDKSSSIFFKIVDQMNITTHRLFILAGLILFLSVSCSRQLTKLDTKKELVIYPAPPDTTRIQYLTSISKSTDITGKQSGFAKFILGEDPAKPIIKPYGVTVNDNKIYICDPGLHGIEIINLEKLTFEYFTPSGSGELRLPLNCCIDERGYLYVADGERLQIVIFDDQGNYVDCFGGAANYKPTDVNVTADKIWVTNVKNNRVSVYDKENHQLLYSFPDSEKGQEEHLYSPTNLYVTDDLVYVSDMGDSKIKIFTHDGTFLKTIGSYGSGAGQLARPKGISVDRNSNLYIVDAGFENTQIFDKEGKLLMFFGGPYNGPGDMWLPAKVVIDYDHLAYFQKYVNPRFHLVYLIFVTNQYGPDKLSVYGFVESS